MIKIFNRYRQKLIVAVLIATFYSCYFRPFGVQLLPEIQLNNKAQFFIIYNDQDWKQQANDYEKILQYNFPDHSIKMIKITRFKPGFEKFLKDNDFSSNYDVVTIFAHGSPYRLFSTKTGQMSNTGFTSSEEFYQKRLGMISEYSKISDFRYELSQIEHMILMSCSPAADPKLYPHSKKYGITNMDYPNIVEEFLNTGVKKVEALDEKLWFYRKVSVKTDSGRETIMEPEWLWQFKSYTLNNGKINIENNTLIEEIYYGYKKQKL